MKNTELSPNPVFSIYTIFYSALYLHYCTFFPFMYKALGIGKLVGAPMAGTMTAVWWETQVNGRIVVGLPEVAVKDMSGKYLENQDLYPDVIVYQTPEERLKDNDVQLKKTIDTLLGK